MMPIRNTLSYLWEKASKQDALYSPAFSRKISVQVFDGMTDQYSFNNPTQQDVWMKALPIEGLKDRYSVQELLFVHHHDPFVSGMRSLRKSSFYSPSGFSRAEVAAMFEQAELRWNQVGFAIMRSQPFKDKLFPEKPASDDRKQVRHHDI